MCMCIMEHACLIRRDEVYLARIPHRSAGADRRGLLLLAAFPLLSPLPLPHPPSFTLSTVWNSFPSFHHHISILLTQPSFSVVWQASVLPSFSSLSVFVFMLVIQEAGHITPRGGLFAPDLLSGAVSVCVSSWSAWDCGASLMQVTPSGAATGQRTESCLHVWMCFVLRADWREKTGGSNRGRKACSKRRTSDRGFGEVGAGSAESASKVKGGSPLTLKRKKWKKGGCFLLRLRGCRESGESGAPQTLWHCNQSPGADWDTEVVNDTEGGWAAEGLHLYRGELTSGVEQGQTKSIPAANSQHPLIPGICRKIPSWLSNSCQNQPSVCSWWVSGGI